VFLSQQKLGGKDPPTLVGSEMALCLNLRFSFPAVSMGKGKSQRRSLQRYSTQPPLGRLWKYKTSPRSLCREIRKGGKDNPINQCAKTLLPPFEYSCWDVGPKIRYALRPKRRRRDWVLPWGFLGWDILKVSSRMPKPSPTLDNQHNSCPRYRLLPAQAIDFDSLHRAMPARPSGVPHWWCW
jgi:hypothetical protein